MTARRPLSMAAFAALLVLGGGSVAGCDEDGIYDESGPVEENTVPTPMTSNPGLSNAGTASPIPTRTDDVGLGGEERSGGEPAQ
jgi:hypothetical protein